MMRVVVSNYNKGDEMFCEICIYFDEHPFSDKGDWSSYCMKKGSFKDIDENEESCDYFQIIE